MHSKLKSRGLFITNYLKTIKHFTHFHLRITDLLQKQTNKKNHLEIGIPFPDSPGAYPFRKCKSTCY